VSRYAPSLIFLFVPLVLLFRGLFASTAYTGLDWNYFLYPFYTFARDVYLEEGRLPFWNPYVMGGMPFLSSLNAFTLYPTELLSLPWRFEPWTFYVLDMLLHLWLAGMGIYALERRLGLSSLPSVVGGLAYSLGGSLHSLVGAGHVRWLRGMGLMPWVFYCLIRSERTKKWHPPHDIRIPKRKAAFLQINVSSERIEGIEEVVPVKTGIGRRSKQPPKQKR